MGDEVLVPFQLFSSEMSNGDIQIQTHAIMRIEYILALMTPEQVRDEMVPLLTELLTERDQILVAMAKRLSVFTPYVGAENMTVLIPIFEKLLNSEETYVRNTAAVAFSKIVDAFTSSHGAQIDEYRQLCLKLTTEEECIETFYSKASACQIIVSLYKAYMRCCGADGADPSVVEGYETTKSELRKQYFALQKDEHVIVRSLASKQYVAFINAVEGEYLPSEFLDSYKVMLEDDCTSIRVYAQSLLPTLAKKYHEMELTAILLSEILPLLKAFSEDASWRVRQAVLGEFTAFVRMFNAVEVKNDIFPMIVKLLQDNEPEVRQLVIEQLLPFQEIVGRQEFVDTLIPICKQLVDDPILSVKRLFTCLCLDLAVMGPDKADSASMSEENPFAELVLRLLDDEEPSIRLQILKDMDRLVEHLPDITRIMTPTIKDMFKDSNWRIRQMVTKCISPMVRELGKEHFIQNFFDEYVGMMRDSVDEVRNTAAGIYPTLVPTLGVEFTFERLFPSVRSMANADYLVRLSMLSSLQGLLNNELLDAFQLECLALVVAATNDKVPNVRIKACKVLTNIVSIVDADISRDHIKPVLSDLLGDKDKDVAHFAEVGMRLCG